MSGSASPRLEKLWARFVIQFVVIVGSILLAFAVDAWWDERKEGEQAQAQLATLLAEFEATQADLVTVSAALESMRSAVASLLPHISPRAPLISLDSLNAMIDLSFRMSTVELKTGSVQATLAGQLALITEPELQGLIAAWPAQVAELRRQSALLEENRELILDYLHGKIPTLDITQKTGDMGRYPRSSFVGSSAAIQRDLRAEGLFGNRGMMIEDTDRLVRALDDRTNRVVALIEESLNGR